MQLLERFRRHLARIPVRSRRECCLCGKTVGRFLPYRGGWRGAPALMRVLEIVGSDPDNYQCPWCGCNDRERHVWLYLRQGDGFARFTGKDVLHFAPEPRLCAEIAAARPSRHVQADLFPSHAGIEKVDLMAMGYPDCTFDVVIANHVLEHVADDAVALAEIRRVLRPGGIAILQTPYSRVLEHTICDAGVTSESARLHLYGQEDHARLYGRDIFERIAAAGLVSCGDVHDGLLPGIDAGLFGVNRDEPFFLFVRR